jgi:hypothetical protein
MNKWLNQLVADKTPPHIHQKATLEETCSRTVESCSTASLFQCWVDMCAEVNGYSTQHTRCHNKPKHVSRLLGEQICMLGIWLFHLMQTGPHHKPKHISLADVVPQSNDSSLLKPCKVGMYEHMAVVLLQILLM